VTFPYPQEPPRSVADAIKHSFGTQQPKEADEAAEALYRGFEVTVFIPDEADPEVYGAVFDAVADACVILEDSHPALKDRQDWDLSVSGARTNNQVWATLDRKNRLIAKLDAEVKDLKTEIRRLTRITAGLERLD
jgi:hypothetical protein